MPNAQCPMPYSSSYESSKGYMYELRNIRWIIARAAVVDTIVASANAIDAQDWQKLREAKLSRRESYLADEIDIDYSEFRGETPRRVTAEEYIKSNPQLKSPPIFPNSKFPPTWE